tara:strand:- start:42 stop:398 length:357 start_codon:yes stop_codon:yes gene_type:complete
MTLKRKPVRKMSRAKGRQTIPKDNRAMLAAVREQLLAQNKAQLKAKKVGKPKSQKEKDDILRAKQSWRTLKAHSPGTAGHKAVTQTMREDKWSNEKIKSIKRKLKLGPKAFKDRRPKK